jgi:ribosomal protein S17E
MGKIKTKLIKRTAEKLLKSDIVFSESFEENKKVLGKDTMPSKKVRNQIAGYLGRLKKHEKASALKLVQK